MEEVKVYPILKILKQEARTLELDIRIDANNPWYVECLKNTAQILYKPKEHRGRLPDWNEFSYDIFPIEAGMY